jgi:hypothetical protein
MGDRGQRQQRNQVDYTPDAGRDPMSPEHRQGEADRRAAQQAATQDPYLNGTNNKRRRQDG